ncbi:hypothetical protein NUSPORA_02647 [Nucleospora cyclopteri]
MNIPPINKSDNFNKWFYEVCNSETHEHNTFHKSLEREVEERVFLIRKSNNKEKTINYNKTVSNYIKWVKELFHKREGIIISYENDGLDEINRKV